MCNTRRSRSKDALQFAGVTRSPNLAPKNKIHRPHQTQRRIQIIQPLFLPHVEDGERREHGEGDEFLQDFQLREIHVLEADAVGWHLYEILEQRDAPTHQRGDPPRFAVERPYQAKVMNTLEAVSINAVTAMGYCAK